MLVVSLTEALHRYYEQGVVLLVQQLKRLLQTLRAISLVKEEAMLLPSIDRKYSECQGEELMNISPDPQRRHLSLQ